MKKAHLVPILGSILILLIVWLLITNEFKSVATIEVKRENNRVVKFEEITNEEFGEASAKEHDSDQEIIEDVQKKLE